MHRLTLSFCAALVALGAGCGGKKTPETPVDKADTSDSKGDGAKEASSAAGGEGGGASGGEGASEGAPKKDECVGFDIGNIEDVQ